MPDGCKKNDCSKGCLKKSGNCQFTGCGKCNQICTPPPLKFIERICAEEVCAPQTLPACVHVANSGPICPGSPPDPEPIMVTACCGDDEYLVGSGAFLTDEHGRVIEDPLSWIISVYPSKCDDNGVPVPFTACDDGEFAQQVTAVASPNVFSDTCVVLWVQAICKKLPCTPCNKKCCDKDGGQRNRKCCDN